MATQAAPALKWERSENETTKKFQYNATGVEGADGTPAKTYQIDLLPKVNLYGLNVDGQPVMSETEKDEKGDPKREMIYFLKDAKAKCQAMEPEVEAPVKPEEAPKADPVKTEETTSTEVTEITADESGESTEDPSE